jgi:hypothetical protein
MNANVTTGHRELTAQELDQVAGGVTYQEGLYAAQLGIFFGVAGVVGAAVGAFFDWLFG